MKSILRIITLLAIVLNAGIAHAADAFETGGNLVINHPKHSSILTLPADMKGDANYRLVIHPNDAFTPQGRYETSGLTVDALIEKSNLFYHKGQYDGALTLLLEAAGQEPRNVRVNNMLGSIYYRLGDNATARKYWEHSLSLNGSQREVRDILGKLPPAETTTTEEMP